MNLQALSVLSSLFQTPQTGNSNNNLLFNNGVNNIWGSPQANNQLAQPNGLGLIENLLSLDKNSLVLLLMLNLLGQNKKEEQPANSATSNPVDRLAISEKPGRKSTSAGHALHRINNDGSTTEIKRTNAKGEEVNSNGEVIESDKNEKSKRKSYRSGVKLTSQSSINEFKAQNSELFEKGTSREQYASKFDKLFDNGKVVYENIDEHGKTVKVDVGDGIILQKSTLNQIGNSGKNVQLRFIKSGVKAKDESGVYEKCISTDTRIK